MVLEGLSWDPLPGPIASFLLCGFLKAASLCVVMECWPCTQVPFWLLPLTLWFALGHGVSLVLSS